MVRPDEDVSDPRLVLTRSGPKRTEDPALMSASAFYKITGVSRDSAGAVLGGATVDLFYSTGDKQRVASTTSDPTTGAFTFTSGDNVSTFFIVYYKAGSPDVAGTTQNNLQFT